MKKLIALVAILVLAGPWFALLCSCCPVTAEASTSTPILSGPVCDCCPDLRALDQEKRATLESLRLLPVSSATPVLSFANSVFSLFPAVSAPGKRNPDSSHSSPPASTPESPLYLLLRTLRL